MIKFSIQFNALKASGVHFIGSLGIAALAAILVLVVWYPYPYRELAGGREIFLLLVSVDVICGPLLTLVLFSSKKSKKELFFDLSCVGIVQALALAYGLATAWVARPLYLVLEVDRFKVITARDIDTSELRRLPSEMQPSIFKGPKIVGIREPRNAEERSKVLFESLQGGRDFGERPDFYEKYEGEIKNKSMLRARKLEDLLGQNEITAHYNAYNTHQLYYFPIMARQDWIAILDGNGSIIGYLKSNGF